jgi:hypothetical protein
MQFLFLTRLNQEGDDFLLHTYERERSRYFEVLGAISRVSRILADSKDKHAIFKTYRPYISNTVDIDVLIFGTNQQHKKAVRDLLEAGYGLVVNGPRSTTLQDMEANIGVDLYQQIAASYVSYMDKQKLAGQVVFRKLPNGSCINTLTPEADLAAIIAHSIIKEHMYTLSEYYSFVYYLKTMDVNSFLKIVKRSNITVAARIHASLTALLHRVAHDFVPQQLQVLLEELEDERFEAARLVERCFRTPHKYHPITIAKSLLEIMKEEETRLSVPSQVAHMFAPNIARQFFERLLSDYRRETY